MLSAGTIMKLKNYPENGFGVIKSIKNGSIIVQFTPVNTKKYSLTPRHEVVFEDGTEGNLGQQMCEKPGTEIEFEFKLKIVGLLNHGLFDQAKEYYAQHSHICCWQWYLKLEDLIRGSKNQFQAEKAEMDAVLRLLKQYRFKEADEFFQQNEDYLTQGWYHKEKMTYLQRQRNEETVKTKETLLSLLKENRFKEADLYAEQNKIHTHWDWYRYKKKQQLQKTLFSFFREYSFREADLFVQYNKENVSLDWYNKEKQHYIERQRKNTLLSLLRLYRFSQAEEFVQQNKDHINLEWYYVEKNQYLQEQKNEKIIQTQKILLGFLSQYNFSSAEEYARAHKDYIALDWYEKEKKRYIEKHREKKKEQTRKTLFELLCQYEFDKSEKHAQQNKECICWDWYQKQKEQYLQKQRDEKVIKIEIELLAMLGQYQFDEAEEYARMNKEYITWDWYQGQISKFKIKAIEESWQNLGCFRYSVHTEQLDLNEKDDKLIQKWSPTLRGKRIEDYETERMTSARRAELAAIELYSNLYGKVEDISILQITSDKDDRWKCADINTNGRWIDVKNARRAFSSPNSFSEHCVPKFKYDRCERDVIISSFLSPYQKAGSKNIDEEPIIWLGEITWDAIANLQHHFNSPYLNVKFSHNLRNNLLPAWLFDYPDVCYKDRNRAISMVSSPEFVLPTECSISGAVLANKVINGPWDNEIEALELEKRIEKCGLSRAVLFLHILDRFCCSALDNSDFPSSALDRIIFPAFSNGSTPLGVFDPLETIRMLLDVLNKVSKECPQIVKEFDMYKLSGPNILRGRTRQGVWKTIFAYCGGWRGLENDTRVRCGQNPIFLGQDNHCPSCGYLVCHKCGFCSDRCIDCNKRQNNWVAPGE